MIIYQKAIYVRAQRKGSFRKGNCKTLEKSVIQQFWKEKLKFPNMLTLNEAIIC